jgi:hypothetical protein
MITLDFYVKIRENMFGVVIFSDNRMALENSDLLSEK